MNINFQSVNYNADSKLIEFAEKRIKKISQFYLNIIDVFVYTKVENTNDRINKLAELKIGIPGDDVVVKKIAKSFEEAINLAADSAERILKKNKERQRLSG
jgi:putative sigma-54 modulation protein